MRTRLRLSSRPIALLLLVLQLGLIAHRVEHYLVPEHMESGEGDCAAFAPVTDPPALPASVTPPIRVGYFVRFWTASEAIVEQPGDRLGFWAHAPPA
jgi:hypothetical protein